MIPPSTAFHHTLPASIQGPVRSLGQFKRALLGNFSRAPKAISDHGIPRVGLRIQTGEDDPDPVTYCLSLEVARQVAFSLMSDADKLDPPIWSKEQ
jgi:hypothetical protein